MDERLENVLRDAKTEVARMRAINDSAELKLQRETVPKAHLSIGPVYKPETQSLNLTDEDKAFLDYIRSGEKKALVEDSTGQHLVSPVIAQSIDRAVAGLVIMRDLCDKRTINKDRLQVRSIG